jgi:E3 ubiquitin-protein ligase CCNP1IP1
MTTNLQPTEDYKTSVLSGLDPTKIMECAGRGLAFWTYQTTQEMYPFFDIHAETRLLTGARLYNQTMGKNLAEKYSHLNGQLDKIVGDANSEIQALQTKIKGTRILVV